jgi:hypothetical protein
MVVDGWFITGIEKCLSHIGAYFVGTWRNRWPHDSNEIRKICSKFAHRLNSGTRNAGDRSSPTSMGYSENASNWVTEEYGRAVGNECCKDDTPLGSDESIGGRNRVFAT